MLQLPPMDARNLSDRIWFGLCETQRKAYYYSDVYRRLERIYRTINFFSLITPAIAVLILQLKWEFREWGVAGLLFLVSTAQAYVLNFNIASDTTASRIMGNQFAKLAEKWRLLWINQEGEELEKWVEHLEDLTKHVTFEHLSVYRKNLHLETQQEAYDELEGQFGVEPETAEDNTN